MGLTDADREMLRWAQRAAEQRHAAHLWHREQNKQRATHAHMAAIRQRLESIQRHSKKR